MTTILDKIVAAKRDEISTRQAETSLERLQDMAQNAPPPRDFLKAIRGVPGERIRLIAEVKKASPSQGLIRDDFDPVAIAKTYQEHGAACISVLTDEPFFQGQLAYLSQVRAQVSIPVLRKDFILDSYQLFEARAAGADAVLLIAECLNESELPRLHDETLRLGMTPLVEYYDPDNLPRVIAAGAQLIGVNNRDLATFEVDLGHSIQARGLVPRDRLMVAESGVSSREDVWRLERSGIDAILVGGCLMAQPCIGDAVDDIMQAPI